MFELVDAGRGRRRSRRRPARRRHARRYCARVDEPQHVRDGIRNRMVTSVTTSVPLTPHGGRLRAR